MYLNFNISFGRYRLKNVFNGFRHKLMGYQHFEHRDAPLSLLQLQHAVSLYWMTMTAGSKVSVSTKFIMIAVPPKSPKHLIAVMSLMILEYIEAAVVRLVTSMVAVA